MSEYLVKRLSDCLSKQSEPPLHTIEISITDRCNLRCLYCHSIQGKRNPDGEIELGRLTDFVDEAAAMGTKEFRIPGGGEPFIRKKETMQVIRQLKEHGLVGDITTNAVLLDEQDIHQLIDLGLDKIIVSLDGVSSKTNDLLRGSGCLERVIKSLEKMANIKALKNSTLPEIAINMVLTKVNWQEIPSIIKLAHSLQVSQVLVQPMIIYHRKGKKLRIKQRHKDSARFNDMLKTAKAIAYVKGIQTNLEQFEIKKSEHDHQLTDGNPCLNEIDKGKHEKENRNLEYQCYQPWYLMAINPRGFLTPCSIIFEEKVAYKPGNLKDIWLGEYFTGLRNEIASGIIPSVCSNCCQGLLEVNQRLRKQLAAIS